MRLTVLGNNGPYSAENGATAGYVIEVSNEKIVLDMGSGVFSRLCRLVRPECVTAVLLSHRHHDHISDMGVFNYHLERLFKTGKFFKKIPCYLPDEENEGVLSVEEMMRIYPYFEFIPMREGKTYALGGAEGTFYALRHGVTNYGVRLKERVSGKVFAYSGDTNVCPGLDKLLEGCDLWLGGAPFIGAEYPVNGGHMSVEVMQSLAQKHAVRALVTHFCPEHTSEEYLAACTDERMQLTVPFQSYEV